MPTISKVTNPVWANSDKTLITCSIDIETEVDGVTSVESHPFMASPNDTVDYGKQIFADCIAGKYGGVGAYVAVPIVAPTLTFLQFFALFTPAEQANIVNSTDTQVKLFILMAAGASMLDMGNPEVIQGVNYLSSKGLVVKERVPDILTCKALS